MNRHGKIYVMTIFRIEHNETQLGPYRMFGLLNTKKKNNTLIEIIEKNGCPIKNPVPEVNSITDEMKFGFSDLENLISWFTKESIKKLYKIGFSVVEYETEFKVINKQVIFNSKNAKKLTSLSFEELKILT